MSALLQIHDPQSWSIRLPLHSTLPHSALSLSGWKRVSLASLSLTHVNTGQQEHSWREHWELVGWERKSLGPGLLMKAKVKFSLSLDLGLHKKVGAGVCEAYTLRSTIPASDSLFVCTQRIQLLLHGPFSNGPGGRHRKWISHPLGREEITQLYSVHRPHMPASTPYWFGLSFIFLLVDCLLTLSSNLSPSAL